MEPGIDPSGEGQRIDNENSDLRERLKAAVSEGVGFFVFGRRENSAGETVEDDTSIPLTPDALGFDEGEYEGLTAEERRVAMQEGLFAELDMTEEELQQLRVTEIIDEEEGMVETVFRIKDGIKFLHLVQEFDRKIEKRRLWTICPDEEPVGFIDDSSFYDAS